MASLSGCEITVTETVSNLSRYEWIFCLFSFTAFMILFIAVVSFEHSGYPSLLPFTHAMMYSPGFIPVFRFIAF